MFGFDRIKSKMCAGRKTRIQGVSVRKPVDWGVVLFLVLFGVPLLLGKAIVRLGDVCSRVYEWSGEKYRKVVGDDKLARSLCILSVSVPIGCGIVKAGNFVCCYNFRNAWDVLWCVVLLIGVFIVWVAGTFLTLMMVSEG